MMTVAGSRHGICMDNESAGSIAASTNEDLKNLQTQKNARLGIEAVRNNTLASTQPEETHREISLLLSRMLDIYLSATEVGNIKIYVDGVDC